ncbi:hypothetical protein OF83DRAFT_872556 [Amylostereum chailletii]|nr:hypothetical protein OF83DRAFT_872556 [Amylostereum chailletii]
MEGRGSISYDARPTSPSSRLPSQLGPARPTPYYRSRSESTHRAPLAPARETLLRSTSDLVLRTRGLGHPPQRCRLDETGHRPALFGRPPRTKVCHARVARAVPLENTPVRDRGAGQGTRLTSFSPKTNSTSPRFQSSPTVLVSLIALNPLFFLLQAPSSRSSTPRRPRLLYNSVVYGLRPAFNPRTPIAIYPRISISFPTRPWSQGRPLALRPPLLHVLHLLLCPVHSTMDNRHLAIPSVVWIENNDSPPFHSRVKNLYDKSCSSASSARVCAGRRRGFRGGLCSLCRRILLAYTPPHLNHLVFSCSP